LLLKNIKQPVIDVIPKCSQNLCGTLGNNPKDSFFSTNWSSNLDEKLYHSNVLDKYS